MWGVQLVETKSRPWEEIQPQIKGLKKPKIRLVVVYHVNFLPEGKDIVIIDQDVTSPNDLDELIRKVRDYEVPLITDEMSKAIIGSPKNEESKEFRVGLRKELVECLRSNLLYDLKLVKKALARFSVSKKYKGEKEYRNRGIEVIIYYGVSRGVLCVPYRVFSVRSQYFLWKEIETLVRTFGPGMIVDSFGLPTYVSYVEENPMFVYPKEYLPEFFEIVKVE